jgi:hypothetical protein
MKRFIFPSLLVLMLVASVSSSQAQSGGGYDLTWSTIDGGGATFSTGGSYSLGGTLGQPDAGLMSGGAYALAGGFWGGTPLSNYNYNLYLPLVLKNS